MMARRWIGPLVVGVLAAGVWGLPRLGKEAASGTEAAAVPEASAVSVAKSDRPPSPGSGENRSSAGTTQFAGRTGSNWTVARANPEVLDELLVTRSGAASGPEAGRQHRGAPGNGPEAQGRQRSAPAVSDRDDLAAQVVAHRRGRGAFMRQRLDELASHQPGCKCAHHLGEK